MKIVALLQMFARHMCVCCLHAVTVEFSTAVVSALCRVTAQAYSMFFWATVCKIVRHMLSDHCMSCLSVCDVGALRLNGWMDQDETGYEGMPRPSHIVLDGDPVPPPKKRGLFCPCLLWPNGWMDYDATWYGGRLCPRRHCGTWGPNSPIKGRTAAPTIRPMSIVAKQLDGSVCHLVRRKASVQGTLCYMGTQLPPKGAQPPPIFGHVCWHQTAGWMNVALGTEVGLGPGNIVLDLDPVPPPPKKEHCSPTTFRPVSIVAKRLDGLRCHLVRR